MTDSLSAKPEVTVACDGSCLSNPGGATGWAWVSGDGRWATGCQPVGTNQIAELQGVLSILRDFPLTPVEVQIDSEYAMKAATVWRHGWKKRGWKTASGDEVRNLGLVRLIDMQMERRRAPIRFTKVPGHDKRNRWPLNTKADRLAGEAAKWTLQHQRPEVRFGRV